jgi:hypothetical protein
LETKRVGKFESVVGCCPFRKKIIEDSGNYLLFLEMSKSFENWFAFVADIPEGHFLYIPEQAKISMQVISKGDTVIIDSKRICFAKGWQGGISIGASQHTIYDNSEASICIMPYKNVGSQDFEFTNFGKKYGKKYTVGYIDFGQNVSEEKIIRFKFSKSIDVYPIHSDE